MRLVAPSLLAALATLLPLRGAAAQEAPDVIALDWTAPADCPSRADVLAQVSAILGHAARHEAIRGAARVTHGVRHWHAELETTTRSGADRRSFDGDSCSAVAHAVAVIVALGAERTVEEAPSASAPAPVRPAPLSPPSAQAPASAPSPVTASKPTPATGGPEATPAGAPAPTPSPSPSAQPAAAPALPAALVPHPSAADSDRATPGDRRATYALVPRLAIGVGAALDTGTLPALSPGGEVTLGLLLVHAPWIFRFDAIVSAWMAERASVLSNPSAGGDFSFVGVGGRARALYALGRLGLGPSVGLESELAQATSFGATAASGNHATWGAFSAGGAASFSLTRALSIELSADAVIPLVRPTFIFTEKASSAAEAVFRPSAASARVAAGVEARFF